jgi:hypothetical protein
MAIKKNWMIDDCFQDRVYPLTSAPLGHFEVKGGFE